MHVQPNRGGLERIKVPAENFTWSRRYKRMPRNVPFDLTAEPSCSTGMKPEERATDIFCSFFKDAQALWIRHSNTKGRELVLKWNKKHRKAKPRVWKNIDEAEAMAFVAVLMWMDTHPKRKIRHNWSRDKYNRDEFVSEVSAVIGLSQRRFCQILQASRLYSKRDANLSGESDRSSRNYNMLHKVNEYYLLLTRSFQLYREPGAHLSLDESMIRFKGLCGFVQSMPRKPIRRGIKQYYLCDSKDAYVFNILTHANQTLPYWEEFGFLFAVCWTLLRGLNGEDLANYLDKGRTLYTDRFYTCVPLAVALADRDTYLVGTVKQARKLMPSGKLLVDGKLVSTLNKQMMPRGSVQFFHDTSGVCSLTVWMDSTLVFVLSSHPTVVDQMSMCNRKSPGRRVKQELPRPLITGLFDRNMAGVDKCDQLLAAQSRHMRARAWYMALFYRGVHLCVTNVYALKSRLGGRVTVFDLKVEIAKELLKRATKLREWRPRPWYTLPKDKCVTGSETCCCISHTPQMMSVKERRRCRFCNTGKARLYCQLCQVVLHGEACWYCYHHPKD